MLKKLQPSGKENATFTFYDGLMSWKKENKPPVRKGARTVTKVVRQARHLLIAEDDEELAQFLAGILHAKGYRVVKVSRVREVLEKIENEQFDLLLLDNILADGEISKAVEQIRLRPTALNGKTPIILMSGGIHESLLLSQLHNIQGALVKPFDHARLLTSITETIERRELEIVIRAKKLATSGLLGAKKGAL